MKKVTFALLSFLFLMGTAASAQDVKWSGKTVTGVGEAVTSTDALTDGFYLMRNVGRATYVNERSNGALYLNNPSGLNTTPTVDEIAAAFEGTDLLNYVVYVAKNAESGKYTLQVESGRYVPVLLYGGGMRSNATAEEYEVTKSTEGENYFKLAGTTIPDGQTKTCYLNGNGYGTAGSEGTLTGWTASATETDNGNSWYQFYPVTMEISLTGRKWQLRNRERLGGGVNRYMYANPESNLLQMANAASATTVFTIVAGSASGKVKLYNDWSGKWVGAIPANRNTAVSLVDETEAAEYAVSVYDDNYVAFDGADQGTANDGANTALHGQGDADGVVRWEAPANASQWYAQPVTDEEEQELKLALVNGLVESQNCVGGADVSNADVAAALSAARETPSYASYQVLAAAVAAHSVGIEAGTYYQIKNARSLEKRYISSSDFQVNKDGALVDGTNELHRTNGASLLPTLWTFEKNEESGKYLIRNANTGTPMGQCTGVGPALNLLGIGIDEQWAGAFEVVTGNYGSDKWMLKEQDHRMNALGADSGSTIGDWNGNSDSDEGSYWQILPVSQVELDIYTDTNWASVSYPFAVSLPEGLTAYVAAEAVDGVLTLQSIEGGVVPARTPVLVESDQAAEPTGDMRSYSLTIVSDVPELTTTNLLESKLVQATGYGENEMYVLASDGNAGGTLKKNGSVTTLPANKAYLPVASVQNGQQTAALQFRIGGGTTAIEGVPAVQAEEEVYYDLSGRRVCYPAHGIYVTGSGKKVFIQ